MVYQIISMNKEKLLTLNSKNIKRMLSEIEIIHLFKEFDGYWGYDYEALNKGKPGHHAELKSGLCSDLFLYSEAILQYGSIRKIIAKQLVDKYKSQKLSKYNSDWVSPTCIAGIPKGAKLLGDDTADILGAKNIDLVKREGRIKMNSALELHDTLLFVEDVLTKGSTLKEALDTVMENNNSGSILPFVLTIINRGGMRQIQTGKEGGFIFDTIALVVLTANEWEQSKCTLCKAGSKRIKPKETEENWRILTTSQL